MFEHKKYLQRLTLVSNIDDAIVYNTAGAHAAELRGGRRLNPPTAV